MKDLLLYPAPYRTLLFRYLRKLKNQVTNAPYLYPTVFSEVPRPEYGYCIYHGAKLAKALGHDRMTVIEFGVAGGDGLLNIEYHVRNIRKQLDIDIGVFGFDTGTGLPAPIDHRDLPYKWTEGSYSMDRDLVEEKLEFAKLVIGDVRETCRTFFEDYSPAPIGAILFDLDYYSSTMGALEIFAAGAENFLPRVVCLFDDILGSNEFIGELRAIEEFNDAHPLKKIAKPYGLSALRQQLWNEKVFVLHDFEHPKYNIPLPHVSADGII